MTTEGDEEVVDGKVVVVRDGHLGSASASTLRPRARTADAYSEDILQYAHRKGWDHLTDREKLAFELHQDAIDIMLDALAPKGPNIKTPPERTERDIRYSARMAQTLQDRLEAYAKLVGP